MGFDAFGLPAEQYAVQTGQHPAHHHRGQHRQLCAGSCAASGWATTRAARSPPPTSRTTAGRSGSSCRSSTPGTTRRASGPGRSPSWRPSSTPAPGAGSGTDPDGRPWAELDAVERREVVDAHRLAYLDEAPVNWCPGLGTVLANEEVTADGRRDRGNFPVFRRPLKQWMMRITAYADRLIDDLDLLDWPELDQADAAQLDRPERGRRRSASGRRRPSPSRCSRPGPTRCSARPTWCSRPSTRWSTCSTPTRGPRARPPLWTGGAATPGRSGRGLPRRGQSRKTELERQAEDAREDRRVHRRYATNPVNGEPIPVFVADYVLMGYGTGAIMAVPGQDERDWEFAEAFGLPIVRTVQPPAELRRQGLPRRRARAINSGVPRRSGRRRRQAQRSSTGSSDDGHGEGTVTYRLRDWLFSRQRYWGEPFPIVYDETACRSPCPSRCCRCCSPSSTTTRPRTFADDDETSMPEPPLGAGARLGRGRARPRRRPEASTAAS